MSGLRRAVRRYQHWVDLRWRRPPQLTVHPASGNPAIYYLTPHLPIPSGGVRVNYRHVDLLQDMGMRAAVLHEPDGFRCTWFENKTPIESAKSIRLCADDILVIPEVYATGMHLLPPEVRKIVFNQGAYHTFDLIDGDYPQLPNLLGIMTVSRDSEELLRFAFPDEQIWRARPVIEGFHPGGTQKRRIAYMPVRRDAERHQLMHLLRSRLDGWELLPISGQSEEQVAALLRESALFLSFSEREGFGLPPAEAMASGSYVIGFTGGGGREFFDPSYCTPIPDGDLTAFAKAIVAAASTDMNELQAKGLLASAHVRAEYSREGLRADLHTIYGDL